MNTYDFKGQVAIVTGGAQGIGAAVAERLAGAGATVVIWDMNGEKAADFAASLSGDAMAIACDVSDWEAVTRARDKTLAAKGRIDVLVNSAGIAGPIGPVAEYDNDAWNSIVAINLTGTFHTNKAVIPTMTAQSYGRIVNIASVAGKEGNPNAAAYGASKAGVIGFTKALAKEVADKDIAVNCVTPAVANTPILEQMTEEFTQFMLSKIPRARSVEVEEIANLVIWIASSECSFTTGSVFDISGGRATY